MYLVPFDIDANDSKAERKNYDKRSKVAKMKWKEWTGNVSSRDQEVYPLGKHCRPGRDEGRTGLYNTGLYPLLVFTHSLRHPFHRFHVTCGSYSAKVSCQRFSPLTIWNTTVIPHSCLRTAEVRVSCPFSLALRFHDHSRGSTLLFRHVKFEQRL